MRRRARARWWSAPGLAVLLSVSLIAVACTDDDSSGNGDAGTTAATVVPATPVAISGLGRADVTGGAQFAAASGLFVIRHPASWIAEEHADGGGVTIGSSRAAIDAVATAPPAADLAFNVTFLPAELFRLLEVNPESPSQAVIQYLMPTDGSDPSAPELIALEGGRSITELQAPSSTVDGAVFVFDAAPGVLGIVSVSAAPGGYEPVRDLVLAMLDSLEFTGDAESLIEVLGPPPTTPGVFG